MAIQKPDVLVWFKNHIMAVMNGAIQIPTINFCGTVTIDCMPKLLNIII